MRALRIIGIALGCFIAFVVVVLIAVRLLVNPNNYKGRIAQAVKSSTGRDLSLPGEIRLSVFPWIGVQFGPATLGNPPGFGAEPFATLQHASLRVRLLPLLLHRQLQIGRVEVDGLDLKLLKNAQGQGNWQMPAAKPNAAPQSSSSEQLQSVSGVLVKQSRVSYQSTLADNVSLEVGHFAPGATVPVKWSLDLTTGPGAQPVPISGTAKVAYGENSARVTGLDARLDGSTVRGEAAITNLATDAMTFALAIDQIDLDRFRSPQATAVKAAPPAARPAAKPMPIPADLVKALTVNGKIAIGSAIYSGMRLTQIAVGVADSGGVAHIAPISAQLYGGSLKGSMALDARGAVPSLELDQSLTGVDIGQLVEDYAKIRRLSGRGTITLNLMGRGHDTDALMRSLDGHVAATISNGALEGVDLWSAINSAVALAQRKAPPSAPGGNSTKFDAFKASADLTNGVASTKDLDIASGDLRVTGQGSANLVTGAVNYRLNAAVLKGAPSGAAGAAGGGMLASIPLVVTGTLTSPAVRPDVQHLAGAFAQQQINEHKRALQQKAQSALKGVFGR